MVAEETPRPTPTAQPETMAPRPTHRTARHTCRIQRKKEMTTNSLVEILHLQNQVKTLQDRIQPFIESDPLNPDVVAVRLQIEFTKGQLSVWLEVAEKLSLN
jgi:hypothetical protein